jgi:hypothetical protein
MAHILFETKPGVKLLITTDKSETLKHIWVSTYRPDLNVFVITQGPDYSQGTHDIFKYENWVGTYYDYKNERFPFGISSEPIINYHQTAFSILDLHGMHDEKIYWYLLSFNPPNNDTK